MSDKPLKYSEAASALIKLGAQIGDMSPEQRAELFEQARKSGNRKVRAYFAELEAELQRLGAR